MSDDSYAIPLRIQIQDLDQVTAYFDSRTTFLQLIHQCFNQTSISLEDFLLSLDGKPVFHLEKSLFQMGVKNYAHITGQFLGKKNGPSFNFNSCNEKDKVCRNFSSQAPQYRIADDGLNLQALCKTKGCKAQNKYVIIQKGFGLFNIGKIIYEDENICPSCKKETEPAQKIGYCNTKLTLNGRLTQSKKKVEINQLADNRYHTYKGSSMESWSYLQIKAQSLAKS